jgi:hypothetical protein
MTEIGECSYGTDAKKGEMGKSEITGQYTKAKLNVCSNEFIKEKMALSRDKGVRWKLEYRG